MAFIGSLIAPELSYAGAFSFEDTLRPDATSKDEAKVRELLGRIMQEEGQGNSRLASITQFPQVNVPLFSQTLPMAVAARFSESTAEAIIKAGKVHEFKGPKEEKIEEAKEFLRSERRSAEAVDIILVNLTDHRGRQVSNAAVAHALADSEFQHLVTPVFNRLLNRIVELIKAGDYQTFYETGHPALRAIVTLHDAGALGDENIARLTTEGILNEIIQSVEILNTPTQITAGDRQQTFCSPVVTEATYLRCALPVDEAGIATMRWIADLENLREHDRNIGRDYVRVHSIEEETAARFTEAEKEKSLTRPEALKAIRGADWTVHAISAYALDNIGNPQAIATLANALKDKEWNVRKAAVEALVNIGFEHIKDNAGVLVRIAAYHPEERIRDEANRLLVGLSVNAIPDLADALEDGEDSVRYETDYAIAVITGAQQEYLGQPPNPKYIYDILHGRKWHICQAAAEALVNIGFEHIKDNAGVLVRIATYHDDRRVRAEANRLLVGLSVNAIPDLADALEDRKWHVREAAARALVNIGFEHIKDNAGVLVRIAVSHPKKRVKTEANRLLVDLSVNAVSDLDDYRATEMARLFDELKTVPFVRYVRDIVTHTPGDEHWGASSDVTGVVYAKTKDFRIILKKWFALAVVRTESISPDKIARLFDVLEAEQNEFNLGSMSYRRYPYTKTPASEAKVAALQALRKITKSIPPAEITPDRIAVITESLNPMSRSTKRLRKEAARTLRQLQPTRFTEERLLIGREDELDWHTESLVSPYHQGRIYEILKYYDFEDGRHESIPLASLILREGSAYFLSYEAGPGTSNTFEVTRREGEAGPRVTVVEGYITNLTDLPWFKEIVNRREWALPNEEVAYRLALLLTSKTSTTQLSMARLYSSTNTHSGHYENINRPEGASLKILTERISKYLSGHKVEDRSVLVHRLRFESLGLLDANLEAFVVDVSPVPESAARFTEFRELVEKWEEKLKTRDHTGLEADLALLSSYADDDMADKALLKRAHPLLNRMGKLRERAKTRAAKLAKAQAISASPEGQIITHLKGMAKHHGKKLDAVWLNANGAYERSFDRGFSRVKVPGDVARRIKRNGLKAVAISKLRTLTKAKYAKDVMWILKNLSSVMSQLRKQREEGEGINAMRLNNLVVYVSGFDGDDEIYGIAIKTARSYAAGARIRLGRIPLLDIKKWRPVSAAARFTEVSQTGAILPLQTAANIVAGVLEQDRPANIYLYTKPGREILTFQRNEDGDIIEVSRGRHETIEDPSTAVSRRLSEFRGDDFLVTTKPASKEADVSKVEETAVLTVFPESVAAPKTLDDARELVSETLQVIGTGYSVGGILSSLEAFTTDFEVEITENEVNDYIASLASFEGDGSREGFNEIIADLRACLFQLRGFTKRTAMPARYSELTFPVEIKGISAVGDVAFTSDFGHIQIVNVKGRLSLQTNPAVNGSIYKWREDDEDGGWYLTSGTGIKYIGEREALGKNIRKAIDNRTKARYSEQQNLPQRLHQQIMDVLGPQGITPAAGLSLMNLPIPRLERLADIVSPNWRDNRDLEVLIARHRLDNGLQAYLGDRFFALIRDNELIVREQKFDMTISGSAMYDYIVDADEIGVEIPEWLHYEDLAIAEPGQVDKELDALDDLGEEGDKLGQAVRDARTPGGPGQAEAIVAAHLGARVRGVFTLGHDGEELLLRMRRAGVDVTRVEQDPNKRTAMTFVVSGGGKTAFGHEMGADDNLNLNNLRPEDYQVQVFHVGGPALTPTYMRQLPKVFANAKREGAITSMDMVADPLWLWKELKDKGDAAKICRDLDVLMLSTKEVKYHADLLEGQSKEEAEQLMIEEAEKIVEELLAMGVKTVVYKLGEHGAVVGSRDSLIFEGADPTRTPIHQYADHFKIEATGMGDAMSGTFATMLARTDKHGEDDTLNGEMAFGTLGQLMTVSTAAASIAGEQEGGGGDLGHSPKEKLLERHIELQGKPEFRRAIARIDGKTTRDQAGSRYSESPRLPLGREDRVVVLGKEIFVGRIPGRDIGQWLPRALSGPAGNVMRIIMRETPPTATDADGVEIARKFSIHDTNWYSPEVTATTKADSTPINPIEAAKQVLKEDKGYELRKDRLTLYIIGPARFAEGKLLLVENNDDVVNTVKRSLARRGVEEEDIIVVKTGEDAQQHLRGADIAVAIVDLTLDGDMTGEEVLAEALGRSIPRVVFSGDVDMDPSRRRRVEALAKDAVFAKPRDFTAAIDKAVALGADSLKRAKFVTSLRELGYIDSAMDVSERPEDEPFRKALVRFLASEIGPRMASMPVYPKKVKGGSGWFSLPDETKRYYVSWSRSGQTPQKEDVFKFSVGADHKLFSNVPKTVFLGGMTTIKSTEIEIVEDESARFSEADKLRLHAEDTAFGLNGLDVPEIPLPKLPRPQEGGETWASISNPPKHRIWSTSGSLAGRSTRTDEKDPARFSEKSLNEARTAVREASEVISTGMDTVLKRTGEVDPIISVQPDGRMIWTKSGRQFVKSDDGIWTTVIDRDGTKQQFRPKSNVGRALNRVVANWRDELRGTSPAPEYGGAHERDRRVAAARYTEAKANDIVEITSIEGELDLMTETMQQIRGPLARLLKEEDIEIIVRSDTIAFVGNAFLNSLSINTCLFALREFHKAVAERDFATARRKLTDAQRKLAEVKRSLPKSPKAQEEIVTPLERATRSFDAYLKTATSRRRFRNAKRARYSEGPIDQAVEVLRFRTLLFIGTGKKTKPAGLDSLISKTDAKPLVCSAVPAEIIHDIDRETIPGPSPKLPVLVFKDQSTFERYYDAATETHPDIMMIILMPTQARGIDFDIAYPPSGKKAPYITIASKASEAAWANAIVRLASTIDVMRQDGIFGSPDATQAEQARYSEATLSDLADGYDMTDADRRLVSMLSSESNEARETAISRFTRAFGNVKTIEANRKNLEGMRVVPTKVIGWFHSSIDDLVSYRGYRCLMPYHPLLLEVAKAAHKYNAEEGTDYQPYATGPWVSASYAGLNPIADGRYKPYIYWCDGFGRSFSNLPVELITEIKDIAKRDALIGPLKTNMTEAQIEDALLGRLSADPTFLMDRVRLALIIGDDLEVAGAKLWASEQVSVNRLLEGTLTLAGAAPLNAREEGPKLLVKVIHRLVEGRKSFCGEFEKPGRSVGANLVEFLKGAEPRADLGGRITTVLENFRIDKDGFEGLREAVLKDLAQSNPTEQYPLNERLKEAAESVLLARPELETRDAPPFFEGGEGITNNPDGSVTFNSSIQNQRGRVAFMVDFPEAKHFQRGRRPVVFLFHGLSGHKTEPHLQEFAEWFRQRGFAVVRIDFTNNKIGDKPNESGGNLQDFSIAGEMGDFLSVAEHLIETMSGWLNFSRTYVGGHSYGGLVARGVRELARLNSESAVARLGIQGVIDMSGIVSPAGSARKAIQRALIQKVLSEGRAQDEGEAGSIVSYEDVQETYETWRRDRNLELFAGGQRFFLRDDDGAIDWEQYDAVDALSKFPKDVPYVYIIGTEDVGVRCTGLEQENQASRFIAAVESRPLGKVLEFDMEHAYPGELLPEIISAAGEALRIPEEARYSERIEPLEVLTGKQAMEVILGQLEKTEELYITLGYDNPNFRVREGSIVCNGKGVEGFPGSEIFKHLRGVHNYFYQSQIRPGDSPTNYRTAWSLNSIALTALERIDASELGAEQIEILNILKVAAVSVDKFFGESFSDPARFSEPKDAEALEKKREGLKADVKAIADARERVLEVLMKSKTADGKPMTEDITGLIPQCKLTKDLPGGIMAFLLSLVGKENNVLLAYSGGSILSLVYNEGASDGEWDTSTELLDEYKASTEKPILTSTRRAILANPDTEMSTDDLLKGGATEDEIIAWARYNRFKMRPIGGNNYAVTGRSQESARFTEGTVIKNVRFFPSQDLPTMLFEISRENSFESLEVHYSTKKAGGKWGGYTIFKPTIETGAFWRVAHVTLSSLSANSKWAFFSRGKTLILLADVPGDEAQVKEQLDSMLKGVRLGDPYEILEPSLVEEIPPDSKQARFTETTIPLKELMQKEDLERGAYFVTQDLSPELIGIAIELLQEPKLAILAEEGATFTAKHEPGVANDTITSISIDVPLTNRLVKAAASGITLHRLKISQHIDPDTGMNHLEFAIANPAAETFPEFAGFTAVDDDAALLGLAKGFSNVMRADRDIRSLLAETVTEEETEDVIPFEERAREAGVELVEPEKWTDITEELKTIARTIIENVGLRLSRPKLLLSSTRSMVEQPSLSDGEAISNVVILAYFANGIPCDFSAEQQKDTNWIAFSAVDQRSPYEVGRVLMPQGLSGLTAFTQAAFAIAEHNAFSPEEEQARFTESRQYVMPEGEARALTEDVDTGGVIRKYGDGILTPSEIDELEKVEKAAVFDIKFLREGSAEEMLVFHCYGYLHNSRLGTPKGGVAIGDEKAVTSEKIKKKAFLMTIKDALAGFFHAGYPFGLGGAKFGIVMPEGIKISDLTDIELERLARTWTKALYERNLIGPDIYVPATDIGLDEKRGPKFMAWVASEYRNIVDEDHPEVVTSKTVVGDDFGNIDPTGGIEGKVGATKHGGLYVIEEVLKAENLQRLSKRFRALEGLTPGLVGKEVAVQGAGKVALIAELLQQTSEATVKAWSDEDGGYYEEKGLNVAELCRPEGFVAAGEFLRTKPGFPLTNSITNVALLKLPVDILVLGATEGQITKENAGEVQAKIVLCLANDPITAEAEEILTERGILVIPDFVANIGAVSVSCFEMLQNKEGRAWTLNETRGRLKHLMLRNLGEVMAISEEENIGLTAAGYRLVLKRWKEGNRAKAPVSQIEIGKLPDYSMAARFTEGTITEHIAFLQRQARSRDESKKSAIGFGISYYKPSPATQRVLLADSVRHSRPGMHDGRLQEEPRYAVWKEGHEIYLVGDITHAEHQPNERLVQRLKDANLRGICITRQALLDKSVQPALKWMLGNIARASKDLDGHGQQVTMPKKEPKVTIELALVDKEDFYLFVSKVKDSHSTRFTETTKLSTDTPSISPTDAFLELRRDFPDATLAKGPFKIVLPAAMFAENADSETIGSSLAEIAEVAAARYATAITVEVVTEENLFNPRAHRLAEKINASLHQGRDISGLLTQVRNETTFTLGSQAHLESLLNQLSLGLNVQWKGIAWDDLRINETNTDRLITAVDLIFSLIELYAGKNTRSLVPELMEGVRQRLAALDITGYDDDSILSLVSDDLEAAINAARKLRKLLPSAEKASFGRYFMRLQQSLEFRRQI